MGDPVYLLAFYAVVDYRMTNTGLHVATMVGGVELAPSGPDRPGDRLGPTSGGSIGSQGWWDTSYLLAFCSAVPAIQGHRAECYGAL